MNNPSFASSEKKVYRFNGFYRWYHFIGGAAFLIAAVSAHDLWVVSIPIAMFSMLMIARPVTTAVIVDQHFVTLKGMFSEKSLSRSSITAIERVHTGKETVLRLWGDIEAKEQLSIAVSLFAFDEAWDSWLSTYKDLSSDKALSLF